MHLIGLSAMVSGCGVHVKLLARPVAVHGYLILMIGTSCESVISLVQWYCLIIVSSSREREFLLQTAVVTERTIGSEPQI